MERRANLASPAALTLSSDVFAMHHPTFPNAALGLSQVFPNSPPPPPPPLFESESLPSSPVPYKARQGTWPQAKGLPRPSSFGWQRWLANGRPSTTADAPGGASGNGFTRRALPPQKQRPVKKSQMPPQRDSV
mmetsp:Transcript_5325/g.9913  ORF Transcript_5325/g.9913 Transcript_5325/m.9913 type:complete len:133 (-) Transcript_5325:779-1177(-)